MLPALIKTRKREREGSERDQLPKSSWTEYRWGRLVIQGPADRETRQREIVEEDAGGAAIVVATMAMTNNFIARSL